MIDLIIFSKNRAVQLELLLRSIKKHAPNLFKTNIIYTYSSKEFELGYRSVQRLHGFDFNFVQEKKHLWDHVEDVLSNSSAFVAFSTDDTVLYRNVPVINMADDAATFSLRYGLNTILQDCFHNRYQYSLRNYEENDLYLKWKFADYPANFNYGYPFGLDMHIYRTDLIQRLIQGQRFNSTNELESFLFFKKDQAPPFIQSFKHSVAVNIPANNLSGVTEHFGISEKEMNDRFLDGWTFDLNPIENADIIGSHQILELRWKK